MNRMKDKVAIVTGGALGIGKATCLMLAREGAQVAVTDMLDKEGQQVVAEIRAAGGKADFWHLDVSRENEVKQTMADIHKKFGRIDALVNNAGVSGVNKPTHEVTEAEWDFVTNINVKGVFFCTKHAVPYLRAQGGSIINLSSIYGLVGGADVPPYHASKGAVRLMSKTDAMIYAADKIRVNSVHPGYIWTPMVENHGKTTGLAQDEFKKQVASLHPLGHMGEPDDIAYGILYLASDESKFVTGTELVIDGGYTAH